MYHLLVSGQGWNKTTDSLPKDRVFEYTDKAICNEFKSQDQFDALKISSIPAIFTSEIANGKITTADIGVIHTVQITKKEVVFKYGLESDLPRLTNEDLREMSSELNIVDFEFHRTHWSIKNVDLFKVLSKHYFSRRVKPKLFKLDETSIIDTNLISLMMPFHPNFDNVYKTLTNTADELDMKCLRVDDIWEDSIIIQDIFSLIYKSRIVICDCTNRNPNVFYETGIAHTLGREVILIAQSKNDIPFDLQHLRYIEYLNNSEGLVDLSKKVKSRIRAIIKQ